MQLNPRQAEAVESSGIQLILAGPGSGRTRVITRKVGRPARAAAEAAYLYLEETKYIPYVPIVAFRKRLSGLVGGVLAGEFSSGPSYDCRWCDDQEICECDQAN